MARIVGLFMLASWLAYRLWSYSFDDLVHIVFCDVGQGDATIIRHKHIQVLVDGGRDDSVLRCLDQYLPPWDKKLEVVVATHPDADHISGLVFVLDNYQVMTLLHNGQSKETADFERFKDAVRNESLQGGKILTAHHGLQMKMNDIAYISVLFPINRDRQLIASTKGETESLLSVVEEGFARDPTDANDNSVVLKLSHKKIDVLLMGDLEEKGESALIKEELITDVEVLKVGHHGAKTSTTPGFLSLSRPEISVISAGKNNSYGHPHPLVIEKLTRAGSLILRTDQDSSIELVSNGQSVEKREGYSLLTRVLEWSSSRGKFQTQLPN